MDGANDEQQDAGWSEPGRPKSTDRAYAVETTVVAERGEWHVEIVVVFADEVVRRRVGTYRSDREARIAAKLIKTTAMRDIAGPLHG